MVTADFDQHRSRIVLHRLHPAVLRRLPHPAHGLRRHRRKSLLDLRHCLDLIICIYKYENAIAMEYDQIARRENNYLQTQFSHNYQLNSRHRWNMTYLDLGSTKHTHSRPWKRPPAVSYPWEQSEFRCIVTRWRLCSVSSLCQNRDLRCFPSLHRLHQSQYCLVDVLLHIFLHRQLHLAPLHPRSYRRVPRCPVDNTSKAGGNSLDLPWYSKQSKSDILPMKQPMHKVHCWGEK